MQGAGGDPKGVGKPVRLHLVLGALNEGHGPVEVCDGVVELPHREVTVAPMTVHASVLGVEFDAPRVDVDGLPVASQIRGATPEPDDGVRIFRGCIEGCPGTGQVGFIARPHVVGEIRGPEFLAQEGEGLHALGEREPRLSARGGFVPLARGQGEGEDQNGTGAHGATSGSRDSHGAAPGPTPGQ